ncbi:hypothetical protein PF003_g27618 [Phytophthora fragariae]|nr:hypothetical protein PF003_g27618 [Phytophthora fragariae]
MSVLLPRPRAPSIVRVKLKWDHELNLLLADSQFEACYRMPAAAFVQLENLLATTLHRSPHAWVQRGYISVENALQLTLRYLAGGVDAINAVSELRLMFPRSPTAQEASAAAFKTLSAEGVFSGAASSFVCFDLVMATSPLLLSVLGVGS